MRIRLNREKIRGKMENKYILTIYGPKNPSDTATINYDDSIFFTRMLE